MIDELTDQLHRYADALEDQLAAAQPDFVLPIPARPRRRPLLAAAAAIVVAVGVGAFVVVRDGDTTVPVRTDDEMTSTTTTTVEDASTTTTAAGEDPSQTPSDGNPATTIPASPTTAREAHVRGSADWPGRDARGSLYVGACPSTDTGVACPSMRGTPVTDDGSFDLTLPPSPGVTTWRVAAFVNVEQTPWQPCVFSCSWADAPLNVVRGEVIVVEANVDHTLALSVSARVVDVFVRDRNGEPFPESADPDDKYGGGVQVTDTRCTTATCPEDKVQMFRMASPTDGATRLVVNPDVRYGFHGQALNMGWPHPQWTNNEDEFWFSPEETMSGAELDEGHVFYVDGAPAESSSPDVQPDGGEQSDSG